MEPIGTITQYFPLIDEDTKNVLEGIMAKASDYCDFVERLRELVLKTENPVMVVYFAIHHSMMALDFKHIERIENKYGHHQILCPGLFFSSAYQGTYDDVKKVHEMADAVLASDPEDWIALEMNLLKFEADMSNYPTTMYKTSTMERIRELIDSNPEFGFYEIQLYDYLTTRAHKDGDAEERLRCINKGHQVAEKFDDRVMVAHFLIKKGNVVMNYNREESRLLLQQAYQIVDTSIGSPMMYADIVDKLGVLDAIRGEFDSAIRHFLQVVTIRERAGLNSGNASLFLSTLYNMIGGQESGLEWGQMAENQFKSRPHLINRAVLNQIWSLILLKQLPEAQILLDTSKDSILRSGDESQLAWFNFVMGVLEMAQGEYELALSSVEQALRIYEKQGTAFIMELFFLHQLAKIEILSCNPGEVVSLSLEILEERALSEDLPGILGLVLVLKADIAILNDDEKLLREIIPHLQLLSEKDNLQFLKPYYESLKNKL
jgi:tetratricopeptide (TPR) repeat protein